MAGTRVLDETYPEVTPSGAPQGDYQHIETSPAMFGGLIGQSEEKLGQGADAVSRAAAQVQDFYNQTTADSAYNKYNDLVNKVQFGDPNDPSSPGYF